MAGVLVTGVVCWVAGREGTAPGWVAVLMAALVSLPLLLRQRWPVLALTGTVAATLAATGTGVIPAYAALAPYAAVALALFTVGRSVPRRPALGALVLALLAIVTLIVSGSDSMWEAAEGSGTAVLLVVAPWLAGLLAAERRAATARSIEQRAAEAVSAEQLRIARDLHDVVGHSLSIIAVKAAVAQHVAQARPEEAGAALAAIEATSRSALTEIRRTVGALRLAAGEAAELGPAPGLSDLPALADRAAQAGVTVGLTITGDGTGLPETAALSAYRIVQEAITNVVKHAAPATCAAHLTVDSSAITIEVTNQGPAPVPQAVPGHGLIGMRERVALFGGEFEAGAWPGGGFRVFATLPYGKINQ